MTITEIANRFEELATENAALKARLDDYENRVMVARTEADERTENAADYTGPVEPVEEEGGDMDLAGLVQRIAQDMTEDRNRAFVCIAALESLGYQIIPPAPAPASSQQTAELLANLPPVTAGESEVV